MKRLTYLIMIALLAIAGCSVAKPRTNEQDYLLNRYRAAASLMILREIELQRQIDELEELFERCLERLDGTGE